MGVPVWRFPGGAGQKRVPKDKKGAVRRVFLKIAIRKGTGQAFSLGRWTPRNGPADQPFEQVYWINRWIHPCVQYFSMKRILVRMLRQFKWTPHFDLSNKGAWNQSRVLFAVAYRRKTSLSSTRRESHKRIQCAGVDSAVRNRPDVQISVLWCCYDQLVIRSSETAGAKFPIAIHLVGYCKCLLPFALAATLEGCNVDDLWTRILFHKDQPIPIAVVLDSTAWASRWEKQQISSQKIFYQIFWMKKTDIKWILTDWSDGCQWFCYNRLQQRQLESYREVKKRQKTGGTL